MGWGGGKGVGGLGLLNNLIITNHNKYSLFFLILISLSPAPPPPPPPSLSYNILTNFFLSPFFFSLSQGGRKEGRKEGRGGGTGLKKKCKTFVIVVI